MNDEINKLKNTMNQMNCKIEQMKKQRFEHSGMKILKVNKLDKKENCSLISHEDGYVWLESQRGKV